jgi:hypothetical protein
MMLAPALPVPPAYRAHVAYDSRIFWADGTPHRDYCVRLNNGVAWIAAAGRRQTGRHSVNPRRWEHRTRQTAIRSGL